MARLISSEEKIRKAVLLGSMKGKCFWFPTDISKLKKKLSYLDSGIKSDPFYHSRLDRIRQRKAVAKEIARFDPKDSKGFYTEINLIRQHEDRIWGGSLARMYNEEINVHFFIDFEKDVRVVCKNVDGGHHNRDSFVLEGADLNPQYLMLPSFIEKKIVQSKKLVKRYRYREDDEN